MSRILLEEADVLDYVEESISGVMFSSIEVVDDKFHHNTRYEDTASILENGLLSGKEQNKIGLVSDDQLELFSDIESHVNGSESISLAVVGLTDLYPDEMEYDPFSEKHVDILISGDVKARRNSTNYGNEYLVDDHISSDMFRAIDTRLLSFIASIRTGKGEHYDDAVNQIRHNYNRLREIAMLIYDMSLDIPIREMSSNNGEGLDIKRLSNMPKVKVMRKS